MVVESQTQPLDETLPRRPLATVVIVSWNCVAALRPTLASLERAQERERIEIQVVDAGSRDGCERMDEEFPSVHVQRMPRNFGKTRARNIGLKTADSDLVLLLEPGVEVGAELIVKLGAALEADPQIVAAVPQIVDAQGQQLPSRTAAPTREEMPALCRENGAMGFNQNGLASARTVPEVLMVRLAFIRGMNFFDERRFAEYGAEYELFWQIHNANKKIAQVEARAIVHPRQLSCELTRAARALLAADRISGSAAYIGKHWGFLAGMSFRLSQLAGAVGQVFSDPGYALPLVGGILRGARIDGNQGGVLA
jgi:GT2 family glycosyltransferase